MGTVIDAKERFQLNINANKKHKMREFLYDMATLCGYSRGSLWIDVDNDQISMYSLVTE